MCGRYVRRSDKQKIAEYFHASPQPAELPLPGADYNVAPTTLNLSSNIKADEELRAIASRFRDLTKRRDALLLALPITAEKDHAQVLSTFTDVAEERDEASLWAFAQQVEALAVDSRALLQKRTGQ